MQCPVDRHGKLVCCVEQPNLPGLLLPKSTAGDLLAGPAASSAHARSRETTEAAVCGGMEIPETRDSGSFFAGQNGTEEAEIPPAFPVPPAPQAESPGEQPASAPQRSSAKAAHRRPWQRQKCPVPIKTFLTFTWRKRRQENKISGHLIPFLYRKLGAAYQNQDQTKLTPFLLLLRGRPRTPRASPRCGRLLARGCAAAELPVKARLAGIRLMAQGLRHFWALKNPSGKVKVRKGKEGCDGKPWRRPGTQATHRCIAASIPESIPAPMRASLHPCVAVGIPVSIPASLQASLQASLHPCEHPSHTRPRGQLGHGQHDSTHPAHPLLAMLPPQVHLWRR